MQAKMVKDNRLIVFFIPPEKIVNGGILSIFSLCKVSRQFKDLHKSDVVLSTYPGHKSYRKNDLFENDEIIYSFDEIVKRGAPRSLLLHVPEYASLEVYSGLKKYSDWLQTIPNLSVNIMTQNIWLLQKPYEVAEWFLLTPHITQTTAHDKTASQKLADEYFLPTHHLSVFNDPRQYKLMTYEKKENLIVLSPDQTEKKRLIINKIKTQLPYFRIITVKNMRYEEYKNLISRAKFAVTFGEGFDGYYIEAFFSGGITFAVYNDAFFPDKEFAKFENTYSDYDEMLKNIVKDMNSLDDKTRYEDTINKNLKKITKLYNYSNYQENLENFYRHKFTYLPSQDSARQLIASILLERDKLIAEKNAAIEERDRTIKDQAVALREKGRAIEEQAAAIRERDRALTAIRNSHSWKVTKPLREISAFLSVRRKPH